MSELYIGLMSGTSLDGVDLALMDFHSHPRLLASTSFPMPDNLRQSLLQMHQGLVHLQTLGEISQQLGKLYAQSVQDFLHQQHLSPKQITAIGCHGQTIWHSPTGNDPFTMQIGNAQLVATQTKIKTVADFRTKDMVLGGQGAPLVPAFHQGIFYDEKFFTAVLNMGGISNVSLLSKEQVIGFDTGPANALLDLWIEKHLGQAFDKNGEWAKNGTILPNFVANCLTDPYFSKPYPKSTGREYFNFAWLNEKLRLSHYQNAKAQDIQASLAELTVLCNVQVLSKVQTHKAKRLLLCGGGAKNAFIKARFAHHLPDWHIALTDDFHIGVDDVEAAAFAWLAYQRLHNQPSNLPSVTGASHFTSLGVIYEP